MDDFQDTHVDNDARAVEEYSRQPGDRAGASHSGDDRRVESDRRGRQQDRLDQLEARRPRRLDRGDGHRSGVRESVKAAVAEVRERDERTSAASPRSSYEQREPSAERQGREGTAERAERQAQWAQQDRQTADADSDEQARAGTDAAAHEGPAWLDATSWGALSPQAREQVAHKDRVMRELDEVVVPHLDRMNARGVTPIAAIDRVLRWAAWIEHDPRAALVLLANQFGVDPQQPLLSQAHVAAVQAACQRFAAADQQFDQRRQAKAQQETITIVERWGKSKPNFAVVRPIMAQMLSGAAAANAAEKFLDRHGRVDLNKLYAAAVNHPDVRQRVSAGRGNARPAARNSAPRTAPRKRAPIPVRESIMRAIEGLT